LSEHSVAGTYRWANLVTRWEARIG